MDKSAHDAIKAISSASQESTRKQEEMLIAAVGKSKFDELYETWPNFMATYEGYKEAPTHAEIIASMVIQYLAEETAKQTP